MDKKASRNSIPILSPAEQYLHHFGEAKPFDQQLQSKNQHFHINRIEEAKEHIHFPLSPHRKTTYDFIFLVEGSSKRSKGLNEYLFSAGEFFFLPAWQITTHEYYTPDAKGFFCQFDGELLNSAYINHNRISDFPFLQYSGSPLVNVDPQVIPFLINIFERLEGLYNQPQENHLDLFRLYLLTLFTELNRFAPVSEITNNSAAIRVTNDYKNNLAKHIFEKQKVAEYAAMLGLTPNHLNKCVKTATGKTAQDLLNEMLLLEAKVLLKQTNLNVSEIAYRVSKQDPSNFGRFFKTKTGLTPADYRRVD
jgi:AraC-like DNA-binding protein